jgi:hypothetical protein
MFSRFRAFSGNFVCSKCNQDCASPTRDKLKIPNNKKFEILNNFKKFERKRILRALSPNSSNYNLNVKI